MDGYGLAGLAPCVRRIPAALERCVRCTHGRKIKNLVELAGHGGADLIFHALRILPWKTLAGGNQQAGQAVDGHAKDQVVALQFPKRTLHNYFAALV